MNPRLSTVLELIPEAARSVAGMKDEFGILTVYLGRCTSGIHKTDNGHRPEISGRIGRLALKLQDKADHRLWSALERRMDELDEPLPDCDPGAWNHAFFCGLASLETVEIHTTLDLPNLAVTGSKAQVLPLVVALDQAARYGVLQVGDSQVRITGCRGGYGMELACMQLEPKQDLAAIMAGSSLVPGRPGFPPGTPDHSFLPRNQARSIGYVADNAATMARTQGWDVLVAVGSPTVTREVETMVTRRCPSTRVVLVPSVWDDLSPDQVVRRAAPFVHRERTTTKQGLAFDIAEAAQFGGPAATGLEATRRAVKAEQARTVVFDGALAESDPESEEAAKLCELVAVALEAGVRVVPVYGRAAQQVRGVGAQLYW